MQQASELAIASGSTGAQDLRTWTEGINGSDLCDLLLRGITANAGLSSVESLPIQPDWVDQALRQLKGVNAEARTEGLPIPARRAKANTRNIIKNIGMAGVPVPAVYPTKDGEVAIYFTSESPGAGVLILCESGGAYACFSSVGGNNQRARYSERSGAFVLGAFVTDELLKLRAWELMSNASSPASPRRSTRPS